MEIHIVSKVVDELDNPSSTIISAHLAKDRADIAAKAIAGTKVVSALGDLQRMTYGVVETAELDLTGNGAALQQLRDEVIRQQARLARGRRS